MTKDERFLIELYKRGSSVDTAIDPYPIAKALGFQDHLMGNILRGLAQANLVSREGTDVKLTPRGEEVVRHLLKK